MGYLRDGEDLDQAFARVKREAIGAAATASNAAITSAMSSMDVPGELVFEAYIRQSGTTSPQSITSGSLVIGTTYLINGYIAGDDFTNVGASSNADGIYFIATGTTPTTWTNSSNLDYDTGLPTCSYILKNTLDVIGFTVFAADGRYRIGSNNTFTSFEKTFVTFGSLSNNSSDTSSSHWRYNSVDTIVIDTYTVGVLSNDALNCYIKIVVLP